MKKCIGFILCIELLLLCLAGCNKPVDQNEVTTPANEQSFTNQAVQGQKEAIFYTVEVTDENGNKTVIPVKTLEENLGKALSDLGVIAGEQGAYGLYVKTVNGITADYDVNGAYWSISKDGEALLTGVDSVIAENGATYQFVYTTS